MWAVRFQTAFGILTKQEPHLIKQRAEKNNEIRDLFKLEIYLNYSEIYSIYTIQ